MSDAVGTPPALHITGPSAPVGTTSPATSSGAPARTARGRREASSWRRRLAVRTVRLVAWTAMLATVAIVAAVAIGGEQRLAVILLAALDGWAVPALAVSAVGVAVLRFGLHAHVRRMTAALAVVAVATLALLQPWPHGGGSAAAAAGATSLRVMALNMQFGSADPAQLVAEVNRARPDVLVLTELTPDAVSGLAAAGLDRVLPFSQARPHDDSSGTGVWSRSPIVQAARIPDLASEAFELRFEVGGTPVTLFGIHPNTPVDRSVWLSDYSRIQPLVARAVAAGEQVVVAGDLNSGVHNGPLVRLLGTGLRDAGTATGWPWTGQSWPTDLGIPRVIRIDHVLATPSIAIDDLTTFEVDGTDHRGVLATLAVPTPR